VSDIVTSFVNCDCVGEIGQMELLLDDDGCETRREFIMPMSSNVFPETLSDNA
jgi:hypothetical protein